MFLLLNWILTNMLVDKETNMFFKTLQLQKLQNRHKLFSHIK